MIRAFSGADPSMAESSTGADADSSTCIEGSLVSLTETSDSYLPLTQIDFFFSHPPRHTSRYNEYYYL